MISAGIGNAGSNEKMESVATVSDLFYRRVINKISITAEHTIGLATFIVFCKQPVLRAIELDENILLTKV